MSPRSISVRSVSIAFAFATLLPVARAVGADLAPAEAAARARQRYHLGVAGGRAFEYFAHGDRHAWDGYLGLRSAVSADKRARSLAMVRKEDVVEPSRERQAKLDHLQPVLAYLDRESATEVKLLRLNVAWAGFLEGAAVLDLSSDAVDLLHARRAAGGRSSRARPRVLRKRIRRRPRRKEETTTR